MANATAAAAASAPASGALSQYRQHKHSTSRKLCAFFGDLPPIDISVAEIRKEGLKAMLHAKIPLCYFLAALLDDYSQENLFFYLELERFDVCTFLSPEHKLDAARAIYATYLGTHSHLEINIDDRVRRAVTAQLRTLEQSPPAHGMCICAPQCRHVCTHTHTHKR